MEGEWPLHIPTALPQGKLLGRTVCVAASRSRFVSKRILTPSEIEPRFSFRLAFSLFTILSYVAWTKPDFGRTCAATVECSTFWHTGCCMLRTVSEETRTACWIQHGRFSDSLRVGSFGVQKPPYARFSTPVQKAEGAHTTYCKTGTDSLFRVWSGPSVALTTYLYRASKWK